MNSKEIKICVIRHGTTQSNLEGRFCGRGNYPLAPAGRTFITDLVEKHPYPKVEWLVSSPALRCTETAQLSFPGMGYDINEDLWELDFGSFEEKPAKTLLDKPELHKKWKIHEWGFAFPNGETMGECRDRGVRAFRSIISVACEKGYTSVAVVTHSMLITLVFIELMVKLPDPKDMFCPNGMGMLVKSNTKEIDQQKPLRFAGLLPKGAPRPDMSSSPYIK